MLFPSGLFHVKKAKRFMILFSNRKFSMQPLSFFDHNRTQKERESTESINYLGGPRLWLGSKECYLPSIKELFLTYFLPQSTNLIKS
jgi:hypothetical protein